MSKEFMERLERLHTKALTGEVRKVPVPELSAPDEDEMVIYVYPLTTAELQEIMDEAAPNPPGRLQRAVNTILARSRFEDGKKMFSSLPVVEEQLRNLMSPALLLSVAGAINEDMVGMFGKEATETVKK